MAAAGLPLAVYLITSARHVLDGDAAVFAAQAHQLGLVHPPGYALMGLLGKLVTSVAAFGPLAWRANLVGVAAGTATLALGYALLRRWNTGRPVAMVAMWLLAFSPLFWSQSLYINPYIVAAMMTLGTLLLLDLWAERRSLWLLAGAGLLCGLGMNAHPSVVLGFPAVALFVLLRLRGQPWGRWGLSAAAGLAGAAAGCLVWLAYTFYYLSDASAAGGLWARFTALMTAEGSGSDWRSFFRGMASRDYPVQLALHATRSLAEFSPVGLALFVVGIVTLARRRRDLLLLMGLMYLAQMNFAATLRHWHHYDVYRLPCFALQALVMGVGLAWVWERMRTARARALALAGAAVLTLGPPYAAVAVVREDAAGPLRLVRPKAPWRAEFARLTHSDGLEVLARVPEGATIVSNYGPYGTLHYLRAVERAGPGVRLVAGFGDQAKDLRALCEARKPGRRIFVYLQRAEARQREFLAERFDLRQVSSGALHVLYEVASSRRDADGK